MKIIQITDLHLNESENQKRSSDPYAPPINTDKSFKSVKNAIKKETADIVMITGDIAQEPTDKAYQRIAPLLQEINKPCYCLAGNHDDAKKLSTYLNSENLHTLSYLDKSGWRIIFLDTSKAKCIEGHLSQKQLEQLKNLLNTKLHVLITMHHHPIPIHSKWMDKYRLHDSDKFLQIINKPPHVKAVIFGHIHQEFEETHQNILFIGTPSTCTQFVSNEDNAIISKQQPAYRKITLASTGAIKTTTHYVQQ